MYVKVRDECFNKRGGRFTKWGGGGTYPSKDYALKFSRLGALWPSQNFIIKGDRNPHLEIKIKNYLTFLIEPPQHSSLQSKSNER